MFLRKPKLLSIAFLLIGFRTTVSAQSSEPLEAAWVKEDIASVAIVLNLMPFEDQSISLVKARCLRRETKTDFHGGCGYG
jgi:hypothetical protein